MKKSLILSTMLLMAAIPAVASVDVRETTTPEYMYNGGYSSEAIRLIQYNKAYANGENLRALEQEKVRRRNFFVKFMDYLDPGRDDGKYMNRDLEMQNPNYEDL